MLPNERTSACGGKVIRRIILSNHQYHAIAQSYDGKIFHEKFLTEREAREYLDKFDTAVHYPRGLVVEKLARGV
jgi:hypothetical protein